MPLNSMVRLCVETATGPPFGVKMKVPGAGPAEGTHRSVPLDEIDALDSGGAVIQRFVGSGGLPAVSRGKEIVIFETVTEPTETGQETTKISEATDIDVVERLTCTGIGFVISE